MIADDADATLPPATVHARPGDGPGEWVVEVGGEIDVATSPMLRSELSSIADDGARRVVLDVAGLTFIDSSGLGVLVGALKRLRERDPDADMVLRGMTDSVHRVFEITGLERLFAIEP